jgi:predicted ATPase/DNA-binding SARP family transcriptional activator
MTRLTLSLLGSFQVILDGEPITEFESDKVRALLAYLAVESGRSHRRESLAGLLWPERPERAARHNLSQALLNLRRAIGDYDATPPFLLITRDTIQLNTNSDYWLDTAPFTALLAACEEHPHYRLQACNPCMDRLQQAVVLYRGSFLQGFSLGDSASFEEWSVLERERLHRLAMAALRHLADCHEQRGEIQQALQYAWRQVELDPWREEAHQQLMRLLALNGRRSEALAQYGTCRRVLAEELGIEPAGKTTRLYERIRDGELEVLVPSHARLLEPSPHPPAFLDQEAPIEMESPVFVARERELAQLNGYLHPALAGQGRIVFVTGEAGSGKTALVQEFARRAQDAHTNLVVASGNCHAYTGIGDPYHPFRKALRLLTGDVESTWAAGAISREHARRLWQTLPLAAQSLADDGPDLIDTFVPGAALVERARAAASGGAGWLVRLDELVERKRALAGAVSLQQRNLFEQYTRVLRGIAHQVPLVLVVDDLQWADLGSTSLLFHLGRRLAGSRILIVGAYRPEEVALDRGGERHPLQPVVSELRRMFGGIALELGRAGSREFVEAFLDTEPNRLGAGFREKLYRQTGGHPLFTVELLRAMQERGDVVQDEAGRWVEEPALDWEALPARVEAAIGERIARVPGELRQALAVASVEGEDFTAEAVARVRGTDEREMVERLSGELERHHRLVRAQGIQRLGSQRLCRYRFRHYLFQRYLYNRLDKAERAYLHEAVGTALEALYGKGTEQMGAIAAQLARHFQEAGIAGKAVDYLLQAGERAVRLFANEEAIAHLTQGLELFKSLPETPQHARQELALQMGLSTALGMVRGHAAPEVGNAYARTRELCRQLGDTPRLFPAVWGLCRFHLVRAELQTARDLAEQLLGLAQRTRDSALLLTAHQALGTVSSYLGELVLAREHLEQGIVLHDPQQHHSYALLYGQDPGVTCAAHLAHALWYLGYPDQALKSMQDALNLAQELAHPLSLVFAFDYAAALHGNRREGQAAQEYAEAVVALSIEQGFSQWLALGTRVRGWALVEQGAVVEGIAQMRQGLDAYRATGGRIGLPGLLAQLAQAYRKAGQAEKGLAVLAEALAAVEDTGERLYEAELHRLRGELLLVRSEVKAKAEVEACYRDVEACFQRAIEVARRQSAKSFELRAVTSLSRLRRDQDRNEDARQMLAHITGWFTEGSDTLDLIEAQALLKELSDDGED